MKTKLIATMTMLFLAIAFNVTPVFAKKAHRGAEFRPLENTVGAWGYPGWINVYVEGAYGKVIFNQPEGAVSVTITGIVHGLPEGTYYAYLWGIQGHFNADVVWVGTWARVATFTVDEYGDGDFHYNIRADDIDAGEYDVTVWVDKAPTIDTYLISPPMTLIIEA